SSSRRPLGAPWVADSSTEQGGLFELSRTPAQMRALEGLCEEWRSGPEQFWSYESVVEAIGRPGSLVVFAADGPEAAEWQGAVLLTVGPFTADLLYIYVRPDFRRRR